ncbi:hypothetical protein SAMN05216499_105108 [Actinacidiphila paucisporea]|uniref:Uncharacterized protein n=1 Tax=Actinacidiphila paucisporea TaxID=310782 RepID=A0A1M7C148_9ACTN|nr:hypothetical protein SAMN05216499_105108 [Actinacidiphila paucisporea]
MTERRLPIGRQVGPAARQLRVREGHRAVGGAGVRGEGTGWPAAAPRCHIPLPQAGASAPVSSTAVS